MRNNLLTQIVKYYALHNVKYNFPLKLPKAISQDKVLFHCEALYLINSARNCISSRRSLVYHQRCEPLYIIIAKAFFIHGKAVMIYSPDRLMRYNVQSTLMTYHPLRNG